MTSLCRRARRQAVLATLLGLAGCNYGRERLLPRPEPLAVHADSSLSDSAQRRLADVRRFSSPYEQEILEHTLEHLARDPRLPRLEVDRALERALSGFGPASGFCGRLSDELRALRLHGPEVIAPPDAVAVAVPIDMAWQRWLGKRGRQLYPDPRALARAIRDETLDAEKLERAVPIGEGEALFVVTASAFDGPGPSAARRACLDAPAASSYIVAVIPRERLQAPLRIPTAADAVCRPHFVPAPSDARAGINCAGHEEFVTQPHPLAAAARFQLSR
ncbi:MAG TPA: hypothetical protein VLC53_18830 [Myxococcota bacterium]|nr:hypothetical protein [Myxococcota bacterium]